MPSKEELEKAASDEADRFCEWFVAAHGSLPYAFHKDVRTLLAKFAAGQSSQSPASLGATGEGPARLKGYIEALQFAINTDNSYAGLVAEKNFAESRLAALLEGK